MQSTLSSSNPIFGRKRQLSDDAKPASSLDLVLISQGSNALFAPDMEEKTFKSYTPSQAQAYLSGRGQDNENLFNVICEHHASTGGSFGTLLDLGCGPGNSTRPLAERFDNAVGVDPSEAMIETTKGIGMQTVGGETSKGRAIEYRVGRAEEEMLRLSQEGVAADLITAGMAAHWFDLPRFWQAASQVLQKGGTVALWQYPSLMCLHPSMPNAAEATQVLNGLIEKETADFEKPGNRLCREAYTKLCMPWDVHPPLEGFSKNGFKRMEWDRGGELTSGDHFFVGDKTITMQQLYEAICTASMVQRWREAYPELVGTELDVAVKTTKRVKELVERDEVLVGRDCVLLLFKKS